MLKITVLVYISCVWSGRSIDAFPVTCSRNATGAGCDTTAELFDQLFAAARANTVETKEIFETYANSCTNDVWTSLKQTNCMNYDDFKQGEYPGILLVNVSVFRGQSMVCGTSPGDAKHNAIMRLQEYYDYLVQFTEDPIRSQLLNATRDNRCSNDQNFASKIQLLEKATTNTKEIVDHLIVDINNICTHVHTECKPAPSPPPESVKPFSVENNRRENEIAELYRELCNLYTILEFDAGVVKKWVKSSTTHCSCTGGTNGMN